MLTRDATVSDSVALAHVQVDSYRTAYAGILPDEWLAQFTYEEQEDDWRGLVAAPDGEGLLVAENGGVLLGYVYFGPSRHESGWGEVHALHVRREHQGRGVGRMLLAAAARRLEEAGCASLLLTVLEENAPARGFYERLGGKLGGQSYFDAGAPVVEVEYRWPDIRVLSADNPTAVREHDAAWPSRTSSKLTTPG